MQDEDIDITIREAAEQHHPSYDDKAWGKMQKLLDKHLPQKKDRKRWFFFLLLFLLLDGVLILAILKPWKTNSPAIAKKTITSNPPVVNGTDQAYPGEKIYDTTINKPVEQLALQQNDVSTPADQYRNERTPANTGSTINNTNAPTPYNQDTRQRLLVKKSKLSTTIKSPGTENDNSSLNNTNEDRSLPDNTETTLPKKSNITGTIELPVKSKITIAPVDSSKTKKSLTVAEEKEKQLTKSGNDKKKPAKGFRNNFGLTLSVGADLSYVSVKNPGKINLLYGGGISYTIAKRFTIRTGFYATHKKYSATPDQYNGPTYPNLYNIESDCNVYEIPLNLSYNFWQRKKHNWFGSVGISSFLMKKEVYNYEYKTTAGQYYNYKRTVNDENKHYFSILDLSAGYQYNINDRFSIMAEPYLKLPLNGIGAGKIKLNSAGVLLSLTVKPFVKRK